jgi:hypothetical protein
LQEKVENSIFKKANSKMSEEKASSSYPLDDSKMDVGSRRAVNYNNRDNSRLEADTNEIEYDKSRSFSKFKF